MSEAKYSIGEAVMIQADEAPEFNSSFSVITDFYHGSSYCIRTGKEWVGWTYSLNTLPKHLFCTECELRPIPREEPNGICANQYIKDLIGETVT